MYLKSKSGLMLKVPTPEEEAAINAAIAADPDTMELDEEWAKGAQRGRPPLKSPKKTVAIRLSQDVIAALKATGKGWHTRVEKILRAEMGL
jgi:uncharacterized protein (DUF4415 family)